MNTISEFKLKPEKLHKKEDYLLYYMSQSEIKKLKEKIWNSNNRKCPLLEIDLPLDKAVLDHKHKLKSEEVDKEKGCVRNCLDFRSNVLEGKIVNAFKRYFGSDESKHPISLPNFLRNLADYLEEGSYVDIADNGETEIYFVHPNEVPKRKKLGKREQNKIKKYYLELYPRRKKIPEFKYYNDEVIRILEDIQDLEKEKKEKKKEKQKGKENERRYNI